MFFFYSVSIWISCMFSTKLMLEFLPLFYFHAENIYQNPLYIEKYIFSVKCAGILIFNCRTPFKGIFRDYIQRIQSTSCSSNVEVKFFEENRYFLSNKKIWKRLAMVLSKNTKFNRNLASPNRNKSSLEIIKSSIEIWRHQGRTCLAATKITKRKISEKI